MEEDERDEELATLSSIFPELVIDASDPFSATLELAVKPANPLLIRFVPPVANGEDTSYADAATNGAAHVERDVELAYLPPLVIRLSLPRGYPTNAPPKVQLSTKKDWLSKEKLTELEAEAANLWEEYGHCQILFSYIDAVEQAAERGFDLQQSPESCLVLPSTKEQELVTFNDTTRQEKFDAETYDCGICLEPKKGSACYQMKRCGHVFCRQCLHDFYNNAIKEGDVAGVKCLDPTCGEKKGADGRKKKRKKERTIHPRELLAMGIEESTVRRYVDMKRKKKLEADKNTVYCPRTWCQGPAKSAQYPKIPADLTAYIDNELSEDDSDAEEKASQSQATAKVVPDPSDRLAVCEKCELAFCKVCYMGWHGPFARCFPRDPNELSAEEKASYDYIRTHTSPCPYCNAPVQKTMGCNHMNCFQCRTHFCYLCGSWLDAENPYHHFNKAGTPCYQRLWELEEGDEGQAPEDGRGFAGGARGWEQMAIEAARQAEEEEAEAAAVEAQADGDHPDLGFLGVDDENIAEAAARWNLGDGVNEDDFREAEGEARERELALRLEAVREAAANPRQRGARRRNPAPARPPADRVAGQAVRNHERARGGGGRGRGRGRVPAARAGDRQQDLDDREQAELQRFLDLAQRDEEDDWDSDELEDERFIIPPR